ncbi:hypothetical protein FHX77_000815 [Bifidobacterium commune]|uniref:Uncharacterized protein n=1 Tax=Bifidobacterium commune TaxID=1505727 RepID=A0A1C4H674_9BIFI|nr:hypothetical protein [Bifidobacterium commune]MBB2955406.1 hypothetical protein [Bifidobacterium commune]SCC80150.1 hypothetical protein GA0061077_1072 [Bifidobacterium commune]
MKYYSEDSLSHPHHPNSDDDSERANRLHEIISEQEELENLRWRENARNEEPTADFLSFAEQTHSLYDQRD